MSESMEAEAAAQILRLYAVDIKLDDASVPDQRDVVPFVFLVGEVVAYGAVVSCVLAVAR